MATAKKAAKKKSRRTVMYSTGGKKLYAVRDASGKFKDIQQYSRAHAMDIARGSSAETKAAAKKAAKKTAKKTAKKSTAKKATAKKATAKKTAPKKAAKRTTAKSAAAGVVKRLKKAIEKVTG
jgi:FKBP-type peptidyl-prolyl cis-trans isomerase